MLLANVLLIISDIMKLDQIWINFYKVIVVYLVGVVVIALVYMHITIIHCASRVAVQISESNKEEGKQIKTRANAAKSGLIELLATLSYAQCLIARMFVT